MADNDNEKEEQDIQEEKKNENEEKNLPAFDFSALLSKVGDALQNNNLPFNHDDEGAGTDGADKKINPIPEDLFGNIQQGDVSSLFDLANDLLGNSDLGKEILGQIPKMAQDVMQSAMSDEDSEESMPSLDSLLSKTLESMVENEVFGKLKQVKTSAPVNVSMDADLDVEDLKKIKTHVQWVDDEDEEIQLVAKLPHTPTKDQISSSIYVKDIENRVINMLKFTSSHAHVKISNLLKRLNISALEWGGVYEKSEILQGKFLYDEENAVLIKKI